LIAIIVGLLKVVSCIEHSVSQCNTHLETICLMFFIVYFRMWELRHYDSMIFKIPINTPIGRLHIDRLTSQMVARYGNFTERDSMRHYYITLCDDEHNKEKMDALQLTPQNFLWRIQAYLNRPQYRAEFPHH